MVIKSMNCKLTGQRLPWNGLYLPPRELLGIANYSDEQQTIPAVPQKEKKAKKQNKKRAHHSEKVQEDEAHITEQNRRRQIWPSLLKGDNTSANKREPGSQGTKRQLLRPDAVMKGPGRASLV